MLKYKSLAANPFIGVARTPIYDISDRHPSSPLIRAITYVCGKSRWQGGQTTVHCVLTPNSVNGKFYVDCRAHSGPYLHRYFPRDGRDGGGDMARAFVEKTVKYLKK